MDKGQAWRIFQACWRMTSRRTGSTRTSGLPSPLRQGTPGTGGNITGSRRMAPTQAGRHDRQHQQATPAQERRHEPEDRQAQARPRSRTRFDRRPAQPALPRARTRLQCRHHHPRRLDPSSPDSPTGCRKEGRQAPSPTTPGGRQPPPRQHRRPRLHQQA